MGQKKECNERQGRQLLLENDSFLESWSQLITSPKWEDKSPRTILSHLDKLSQYPVDFATYLVDRAVEFDLPFVVQDNCVDELFAEWERQEAIRNFVPPTVEEVTAFCREKGYGIDPAKFVRYYEKRGWRDNYGQLLTAWRANVVTWNYNKIAYEWD